MITPHVNKIIVNNEQEALQAAQKLCFPVVMKVIGPLHKSDVGGVAMNISSNEILLAHYNNMMEIPDAQGVMIQKQQQGLELFIGVSFEEGFGHLLLMGLGGIFVEILGDIKVCLCPCSKPEIILRLKNLKGYPLLQGIRGKQGIDIETFAEIIQKISHLTQVLPEIVELDINPLLGEGKNIVAVDMRTKVKIENE